MSNEIWIGVDLGKSEFEAAVVGPEVRAEAWPTFPWSQFEHSPKGVDRFVQWIGEQCGEQQPIGGICVEATGRLAWRWLTLLDGRIGAVSIVNPALPSAFACSVGLRDKTDRIAACVLGLYGRTMCPRQAQLPSPAQAELRELYMLHGVWQREFRAYSNRLEDGPTSAIVRRALSSHIRQLERKLAKLQRQMDELIDSNDQLRCDMRQALSITSIGPKTARALLAEYGDMRRYSRNEIVALAGLYPKQFQSGTSVYRRARLVKGGGSRIRAILYMCAMNAVHHNPHMRLFAQRLKAQGKTPMAIIGAVMRKMLLMVRAVIVSGKPYDPTFGMTSQKPT